MISRVALSGVLAFAGLPVATTIAHADITQAIGPRNWCPGKALPQTDISWDMGVCHTYYTLLGVKGNVGGHLNNIWDGDNPPVDHVEPAPFCGLFGCTPWG